MNPSEDVSVLVVDDDPAISRMLRVLLQAENFKVRTAQNGQDALQAVENNQPDIILLDLQMPVMDGRTFYTLLRSAGFTVPVIVISAFGAGQAREELQAQGSLDKPFEPEEVTKVIKMVMNGSNI